MFKIRKNKCLEFDGVSDYVNCGNDQIFNIVDEITFAVWAKRTGDTSAGNPYAPDWMRILTRNNHTVNISSHLVRIRTSDGSLYQLSHGGLIPLNEWVHLILVFDNGKLQTYRNGIQINSSSDLPTTLQSDSAIRIGGVSDRFFNGQIDDVRIYNRALRPEEIRYLYETTYRE